jgi:LPPG:FO 2-phospho-L-lactate transferase
VRSRRLAAGERLTEICLHLQRSLAVPARILPMTDASVRTEVRTDDGWLEFQDYFVRLHQQPEVREVRFTGAERATAAPEVLDAIGSASVVVVAPSNPIVSIGPILAVAGVGDGLGAARARGVPIVAVSGIVGGKALKGPADRMLTSLGHEPSALGVARLYAGWVDTFVLDSIDATLGPAVEALGMRVVVTDTIMSDDRARARLAKEILDAVGG